MDDRIAEIREALERWKLWKRNDYEQAFLPLTADLKLIRDAAQAWVDLLDSDALILRRDKISYEAAAEALASYTGDDYEALDELHQDQWRKAAVVTIDAALASSQGVEPQ